MQKYTEKLKEHVWCIIAVAIVILLSVVSFWLADEGMTVVSFAASALSITLSIIVIVFVLLQNHAFEDKLRRLEDAIKEISAKTNYDVKSVQENEKS